MASHDRGSGRPVEAVVRIPLIMDANGKWAVSHSHELEKEGPDWNWIDEMADHETPLVNPRRFWVTVEVPLPTTAEIIGNAEPIVS